VPACKDCQQLAFTLAGPVLTNPHIKALLPMGLGISVELKGQRALVELFTMRMVLMGFP
jgi:hypothetical protein